MKATILGLALLLLGLLALPANAETEKHLISFEMKDQFGKEYSDAEYAGKITILIASDKDGSQYNRLWAKAIWEPLREKPGYDQLISLPVAHLKGVPFFLKGFIRGKFPKDPENWVLMDWKGSFGKAYGFTPEACNIMIFDPSGEMIYRAWGKEIDERKLGQIHDALRDLMAG